MFIIQDGIFETSFIDLGQKLSWLRAFQLRFKSRAPHFLTLLNRRYCVKLHWKNSKELKIKHILIQEDLLFRHMKQPWICLLERQSEHIGIMTIGGHQRLLFKRPIASLDHLTRERDECIETLKVFFPEAHFVTYQRGFPDSGFLDLPPIEKRWSCSHYLLTLPYELLSLFGLLSSLMLSIVIGVRMEKLEELHAQAHAIKPEIFFMQQYHRPPPPLLEILETLQFIRYFHVTVNKIFYENLKMTIEFLGPNGFERSLFPILKLILQKYKVHYQGHSITVQMP